MKNYYMLLVLALFAILFGVIAIFAGWQRVTQGATSLTWPTAEGEITYSQIEPTTAPERTGTDRVQFRYHAQIRYEYTVDDVTYEGHQLAFADPPGERTTVASRKPEPRLIVTRSCSRSPSIMIHTIRQRPC